jgi:hypothetical protein
MKLIKFCFGLLIFALAIWLLINWLHNKKETRELLSWIHVSVSEIDKSIPPGLLLEVENSGPRIVGKTHFRLVFTFGDKTICRVDTDYGNFKPDEKRRILLKCKEEDVHRSNIQTSQKVSYYLQVFPEWKKGLEPIEGEFVLNQ